MTSCKTSLCPFKDCCDRVKLNPAFGDTYMIDPYEVVNGVTVCDIYIGEPVEYDNIVKKIKRSQSIKNVLDQKSN